MKKGLIIFGIIITIILAVLLGVYIYNIKENKESINDSKLQVNNNINVDTVLSKEDINSIFLETNSNEEKTTPNTLIILKTYFNKCNHVINEYIDADEEYVNLTKDEIQNVFKGWDIEKFSKQEIILSIEKDEFCDEHFIIREENGTIVIYKVDENGEESLYDSTSISTEYLTTEDLLKIKNGIKVYGKETLSNIIEDFE